MKVFVKETGLQIAGGNVGVTVFDYLSNYLAGTIIPADASNRNVMVAAVNTIVKGLGGAAVMVGASKVPNKDAGNFLVGMGGGPIMTILNDWVKVAEGGVDVSQLALMTASAKKGVMPSAVIRQPVNSISSAPTARAAGTTSTQALRVGVF